MTNNGLGLDAPPKRRSVAQRYKLQENLRVSPADNKNDNIRNPYGRDPSDGFLVDNPFLPMPPPPPPAFGVAGADTRALLPPCHLHADFHHGHHHGHDTVQLLSCSGPPSACSDCSSADGADGIGSGPPSTRSNSDLSLSLAADVRAALSAGSASSSRASSACGGGGSGSSTEDTASSSSACSCSPPELADDGGCGYGGGCLYDLLAATSASPFAAAKAPPPPRLLPPPWMPPLPPPPQQQQQEQEELQQETTQAKASCERAGSVSILCSVDSGLLTTCQGQQTQAAAVTAGTGAWDPLDDSTISVQQLLLQCDATPHYEADAGGCGGGVDFCFGGGGDSLGSTGCGSSTLSRSSSLALSFADFVHRDSLTDPEGLFREVQQQQHGPEEAVYGSGGVAQHQRTQQHHQHAADPSAVDEEEFSFAPALAAPSGSFTRRVSGCAVDVDACDVCSSSSSSSQLHESGWSRAVSGGSEGLAGAQPAPQPPSQLEAEAAATTGSDAEGRQQQQQEEEEEQVAAAAAAHCSLEVAAAALVSLHRAERQQRQTQVAASVASASAAAPSDDASSSGDDASGVASSSSASASSSSASSPRAAPPSRPVAAATAAAVDLTAVDSAVQLLKQLRGSLLKAPAGLKACGSRPAGQGCQAAAAAATFAAHGCAVPPGGAVAQPAAGTIGASLAQAAQSLAGLGLLPPPPPAAATAACGPTRAPALAAPAAADRAREQVACEREQRAAALELELQKERAARAELERQLQLERAALAAQLQAEREERAALAWELERERAARTELAERLAERDREMAAEREERAAEAAALRGEMDELLLCLGQESTKVAALVGALRAAGGDAEGIVERVECEFAARDAR